MAYTPRTIKDRVAVGDDIFLVEDLGNNRIRLIPTPTHVSEAGTPVNKALLQPIEDYLATGVVPVERNIKAGDGLSGGGTLAANRTLSLGTPSTLSGDTSNNVTATSHTHAISVATQAEAEEGTNNVKLMTPLRVANALKSIKDALFPAGGRIITFEGNCGGTTPFEPPVGATGSALVVQAMTIDLKPGENLYLKEVMLYRGYNYRGAMKLLLKDSDNRPTLGIIGESPEFGNGTYTYEDADMPLLWNHHEPAYRMPFMEFRLASDPGLLVGLDRYAYWKFTLIAKA